MDTNPKTNTTDDNLGIAFTNDKPNVPTPKGLLGSNAQAIKANQSHLSDHGQVFDVGRAFSRSNIDTGTIVSDKKQTRPTLGENLQSAFSEWWGKTTDSVSHMREIPEKSPTPRNVPKAETRSAVVQKALSQTTIAPRDDHHIVVEKFRTYKQDVAKITGNPIVIKEVSQEKPEWKHIIDETTPIEETPTQKPAVQNTTPSRPLNPDVRSAMVAPIVDEKVRKGIKSFGPAQSPKKVISYMPRELGESKEESPQNNKVHIAPSVHKGARAIHDVVEPPVQREVPRPLPYVPEPVKREEVFVAPAPKEPEPTPVPVPEALIPQQFHSVIPSPEVVKEAAKEIQKPKEKSVQTPIEHSNAFKTFIMKWAIVVLIVLLGIALAVIASFYFNVWKSTSDTVSQEVSVPTFFETSIETPILFENSKQAFLDALLLRIISATADTVHIYPTLPDGAGERPATSEEILGLLSVNLPGKTLRALEDTIMFGSVKTDENEPFIVLRSYNFDTLFAGLLDWEKTMQADFTPLFGAPVPSPRFTDAVRDNKSIRILYDDSGAEVLLYSFIDKNTVVITTSGEALARLITQF